MTFAEILVGLGLNKAGVITGAIGAGVAAMRGENKSKLLRVLNFTIGFGVASYGSSLVILIFKLPDSPTYQGALGFTLGYLGMTIMDAALLAAEAIKSLDFKAMIEKFLKRIGVW